MCSGGKIKTVVCAFAGCDRDLYCVFREDSRRDQMDCDVNVILQQDIQSFGSLFFIEITANLFLLQGVQHFGDDEIRRT